MKNQSGVSLITLVITIIVVIILAAIALGGGALDTAGQAQFSGFASEMGALKETFAQAVVTTKGTESIRGNTRTDAQLINYIARGAETVISGDDSDKSWLTSRDADLIPCTPINRAYGIEFLDMPTRKVETYNGSQKIVSYFVTPLGNVFCWPPYVYDEKSYVTNTVTVKSAATNGEELSGTDATNGTDHPLVYIVFDPGTTVQETIVVSNTDAIGAWPNGGTGITKGTTPSVHEVAAKDPTTGGYATGFTFDSLTNYAGIEL